MSRKTASLLVCIVLLLLIGPRYITHAAINESFTFQGKVVDDDGTNLTDSDASCVSTGGADTCDFRVSLYTAVTGGTLVWQETKSNVELYDNDGIFNLVLDCGGTFSSCDQNGGPDFNSGDLFVEVEFDPDGDGDFAEGETFSPRREMTAVPYAFNANQLDGVDGASYLRSDTSDNVTSGTLTLDSGTTLDVSGDIDIADTDIVFTGASTDIAVTGDFSINTNNIFVDKATGNVGVGTASPNDALEVLSTSDAQLRLAYDGSNYFGYQVASDGGLTLTGLGTDADYSIDLSGATDGDFSINTDDLFVDTSAGKVGIGTNTIQSYARELQIGNEVPTGTHTSYVLNTNQSTDTSGAIYGFSSLLEANPTANSSGTYVGVLGKTNTAGASYDYTGSFIGVMGHGQFTSGGGTSAEEVVGVLGYGGSFSTPNTVTDVIGVQSQIISQSNYTNIYGLKVEDTFNLSGTATNGYGLYLGNTLATNDYGVYQVDSSDDNYFAGNVGIGDSTPGAKLEVGDGTDSLQISSVGDLTFVDADGGASITGPAGGTLTLAAGASQDLTLTGADDIIFDDAQVTNIQLSDVDTSLPNSNTGIVDAINDAYNAATGGGGGLWSTASNVIYPTTSTDDFAIGGTTLASSIFSIDESAGTFLLGGDQSANPTLNFEATDSDAGTFGFNDNDAFYFSGANVGIGTTSPSHELVVGSPTTSSVISAFSILGENRIGAVDNNIVAAIKTDGSTASVYGYDYGGSSAVNLLINEFGGNVGIGHTTPDATLEVGGPFDTIQLSSTGDLTFVDADGGASITGPAGGALSMVAGASQALTLTGNAASTWSTTAGDLTLDSAAGSLNLTAGENAADSIVISSDAGGIDITAAAATAGEDIDITSAGSSINLSASEAANDALTFTTSNAAGGIDFTTSSTTVDSLDFSLANTTGDGFDIDLNSLTTGTGLDLTSTSTGLTSGSLANLYWNPGSATTATGDLLSVDIGSNASTTGNLFALYDNGADVFKVSTTGIESAVPHSFTSAGDVSFAYDVQFTNQTASYIKSKAPLYIDAGEVFESNDLTLNTYNNGSIVLDAGDSSGDTGTIEFDDGYIKGATTTTPISFVDASSEINSFRTNFTNETLIGAINEAFDAATGSGGGLWSTASSVVYPTTNTDDFAVGGSTLASSIFSIDESAGTFLFGGDQSANPTLNFEATDSDAGTFGFNTNDAFYFSGANVGIGITNPTAMLDVEGNTGSDWTNPVFKVDRAADRELRLWHSDDTSSGYWTFGSPDGIALELDDTNGKGLYLESAAGNVGIGTDSPSDKLHLYGAQTTARLQSTNNYDTQTRYIDTSGDFGIGLNIANTGGAGNFGIYSHTAGAHRLTIDTSGNVGIGDTTPGSRLHVAGDVRVDSGNKFFFETAGTNNSLYRVIADGSSALTSPADIIFGSGSLASEYARITSTGLGINIASPSQELHVSGEAIINSSEVDANDITPAALDIQGAVLRLGDAQSTATFTNGLGIKFHDSGIAHASLIYDSSADKFHFGNSSADGNSLAISSEAATIDNTNLRFGVNSATPLFRLDVVGDDTAGSQLAIRGETDGNNRLYIGYNTASNYSRIQSITEGTSVRDLVLQDAGGNVGIGDETPDHMLDVAGNIGLDASGYINWGDTDGSTGYGFRDNAGTLEFKDSGGAWAAFGTGGGGSSDWDGIDDPDANATINLASYTSQFDFTGTTTTGWTYNADSLTTGIGHVMSLDGLTSGTGLSIASTSTALTSGKLIDLDWNPGSATTATGDLISLDIGANATLTGNLFALYDNTSDVFKVSTSGIESAVPHSFTSGGDVSVGYDIVLTNQTASKIEAYGPLTIEAGESFENNDLTLKTYGTGEVVLAGGGLSLETGENLTLDSDDTGDSYFVHDASNNYISTYVDGSEEVRFLASGSESISTNEAIDTAADFDIAETYPTFDDTLTSGDLVEVAYDNELDIPAVSKRANLNGKDKLLGIVSTSPAYTMGAGSFAGEFCSEVITKGVDGYLADYALELEAELAMSVDEQLDGPELIEAEIADILISKKAKAEGCLAAKEALVALAGRVPTKVALTNGEIKAGDYITISAIDGVGEKASGNEMVVGMALEDFNVSHCSEEGNECNWQDVDGENVPSKKIMVFVNTMWMGGEGATLAATSVSSDTNADSLGDMSVSGNLDVFGQSVLTQVSVLDELTLGTTSITDSEINTIGGTLFVQNAYAAGDVDFFDGKVVMTTDGNVTTRGEITASKINIDTSDETTASIGTVTIPAGQTQVTVSTESLTDNSLIFATPNVPVAIGTSKLSGDSFIIEVDAPKSSDIEVNWWVVN